MSKVRKSLLLFAFSWCLMLSACGADETKEANETNETMEFSQQAAGAQMPEVMEIAELPEYTAADYVSLDSYTGMEGEAGVYRERLHRGVF